MADPRKTIVIASVLNPVDDSRMYEKLGLTLAGSGKYNVHIVGHQAEAPPAAGLTSHAITPFARLSLRRLLAPWRIFFIALRVRPAIFVIETHELLLPAAVLKLFIRSKVIYDVRENYFWNILYTTAFPLVLKPFVAFYVRGKETLFAPWVDHFLLAEKGYERELRFPRKRYTIIENKVRVTPEERAQVKALPSKETVNLIFSGTIAETTGVFTAIELAIKLHVIDDRIRLTIIGFSPQRKVLEKVRMLIQPRAFIRLIAPINPVPHTEIFKHIGESDFGMITYHINPSTMNSIPTKMYEYLGFHLPILLVNHKPWVDFCLPYAAAVVFDPLHYDAAVVYREMIEHSFYSAEPSEVYWKTEEPRLLQVLSRLS
ncbi:MAG: hypothetical protein M3Y60_13375 [Bacteroidota bacterium]|nr:hypothetical protein [Bacteroidota bacterium]